MKKRKLKTLKLNKYKLAKLNSVTAIIGGTERGCAMTAHHECQGSELFICESRVIRLCPNTDPDGDGENGLGNPLD